MLLKCDPRVLAKCPNRDFCKDDPYYAAGSECEEYNEKVLTAPMTNADRIRNMTDKELALVVACPGHIDRDLCMNEPDCHSCIVKWLQSPSEEG